HNAQQGQTCPAILTAITAWIHHLNGHNGPVDDLLAHKLADIVKQNPEPAQAIVAIFGSDGPLGGIWTPNG
ncbi:MAG: mannitol dehydrogenase family protein, partial [Novosphingobium sp.]